MNKIGVNFVFFLIFTLNFGDVFNLKITELSIPKVADPRDNLVVSCKYDMNGQKLYSVKWYKDEQEFYRYIPTAKQQNRFFHVPGVHTMRTDCGVQNCDITLDQLSTANSGGAYKCEVSLDAPTFAITAETHNLTVAVLGDEDPYISGSSTTYQRGDLVQLTCTSAASNPASVVTWYLNDKKISTESRTKPAEHGLTKTYATLSFYAEKKHFSSSSHTMLMKCVATSPALPSHLKSTTVTATLSEPSVVRNQKLEWATSKAATSLPVGFLFLFSVIFIEKYFS